MKKLLILASVLLILTACEAKEASKPIEPTEAPVVTGTEEPKASGEEIKASEKSAVKEDFSEVTVSEYDFNSDGAPDTVTLYSNAEVTENGRFMWEDFHQWILEVKLAEDEYYTLFDGSISTGQLYFEIAELYNEDVLPIVTTFLTTSSSLDINQFSYNGDCFVKDTVYSTEDVSKSGINRVFSSIPSYR